MCIMVVSINRAVNRYKHVEQATSRFQATSREVAVVQEEAGRRREEPQTKDQLALSLHATLFSRLHFRLPIKAHQDHLHTVVTAAVPNQKPVEHCPLAFATA